MYRLIIIIILIGRYLLDLTADLANLRRMTETVPAEFQEYYDSGKYTTAQSYLKETTRFGILEDTVETVMLLVLIFAGGFNVVDRMARSFGWGSIATGLIFAGILVLGITIFKLPFSAYDTFVIEQKYGFNPDIAPVT